MDFANGADGPDWRTRWTAPEGLTLGPGARFLLTDRNWQGGALPDVEVWLGLQNGPDALRLARDGVALDLVGWGALTDTLMMEGAPAPSASGAALARRPDGRDTDDNSADFVVAAPTPGAPNFMPWAWSAVGLGFDPPSLGRAGAPVVVTCELQNDGLEDWGVTTVLLEVGGVRAESLIAACPAGQRRTLTWLVRPVGRGALRVTVAMPTTQPGDSLRLNLGRLQVGSGLLVLNEVMAAPGGGEGEWVEVRARGSVDLTGWKIRDEGGEWRNLPEGWVDAEERLLLAQDTGALTSWIAAVRSRDGWPGCTGPLVRILAPEGWPSLNNTAPAERTFADRLWLADSNGTVVDHVVLGERDGAAPVGLSWERAAWDPVHPTGGNWGVCTARAGATPGCPNSLAQSGAATGTLEVTPPVLDPAQGAPALHLRFLLTAGDLSWRLRLYDLGGAPVRDFGGDALGPGPRDLVWDGRDDGGAPLPSGGYVVLLVVAEGAGGGHRRERALVVVRR